MSAASATGPVLAPRDSLVGPPGLPDERVPDAAVGDQPRGPSWVVLDLAPQVGDVDLHCAYSAGLLRAPQAGDQGPRLDRAVACREQREDPVLGGGQCDHALADENAVP